MCLFFRYITARATAGIVATLWLFPIDALAQPTFDAPGINVEPGALLFHHPPLKSPGPNIRGDVVVEATVNKMGEVTDARAVTGPEEARQLVLARIHEWHYSTVNLPPQPMRVIVHFGTPPPEKPRAPEPTLSPPGAATGSREFSVGTINYWGLRPELVKEIERRVDVHVGDKLDGALLGRFDKELKEIDKHIGVVLGFDRSDSPAATLTVCVPENGLPPPPWATTGNPYTGPAPVVVPASVAETLLLRKVAVPYSDLASKTNVRGTVRYRVIVGTDGVIQDIHLVSGNPMLATPAAAAAVGRWLYKPYVVDGAPVPIQTEIVVNFP